MCRIPIVYQNRFQIGTTNYISAHVDLPNDSGEYPTDQMDYTITSQGEELKEWLDYLISIAPEVKENVMSCRNDIAYMHHSKFSAGALVMVSQSPPAEEAKYLQQRAATVFDPGIQAISRSSN